MKEHESRVIKDRNEKFYFYCNVPIELCCDELSNWSNFLILCYVDSNNFVHNLAGPAWVNSEVSTYHIHGKQYYRKEDWDIERNRLLMLE